MTVATATQKEIVGNLATDIMAKREARLASKITARARNRVWASSIPTCERQGVYEMTQWDQKRLHDTHLQARFEEGHIQEEAWVRELGDLGFEVVERQVSIEKAMSDKYNLAGYIDGKIKHGGRRVPFEIKSMHPNFYALTNTIEDIKGDEFLIRYFRQMQVYLLGHNEEAGIFFLGDCLGHWKPIVVALDYAAAEEILKSVENINAHAKAGTLPDRIKYSSRECGRCAFAHVCLPDVLNAARAQFSDDPEIESKLKRRAELAPARKEYETIDAEVKEQFQGVELAAVGEFVISGKEIMRTSYDVPDTIKKQYSIKKPSWRVDIKDTTEKDEE